MKLKSHMSDATENAASARTPADFLKSIKGKPVVVKLNFGVDYRGQRVLLLHSKLPRSGLHDTHSFKSLQEFLHV